MCDHLARAGTLPFWKATTLCGAPLLGNGQSALFAPLNLAMVALVLELRGVNAEGREVGSGVALSDLPDPGSGSYNFV